ncbi:MAG: glycosyl hydrolase family 8 [Pseudomonadota bacterium]
MAYQSLVCRRNTWIAVFIAIVFLSFSGREAAAMPQFTHIDTIPTVVRADEWAAFKRSYIRRDGRVVDVEKDGVTHSEGQGYGMLLAVFADDRATFDSIATFTFQALSARRDRLMSWLYDPGTHPPLADQNNASDGDILIAYALVKAALKWDEPRYIALAQPIIDDIGRLLLNRTDNVVALRPAVFGFDRRDQEDGPVVNLSYYVYGALLLFSEIRPNLPFFEAWQSGLLLTEHAISLNRGLAPDWISLDENRLGQPALGFKPTSAYESVRIPLYMMLGGRVPMRFLSPFDEAWNRTGSGTPRQVNLITGRVDHSMADPGYRAIAALTACAVRGVPLPQELQDFRPSTYFSSSLHLMVLAAARAHYPHCTSATSHVQARQTPHRSVQLRSAYN